MISFVESNFKKNFLMKQQVKNTNLNEINLYISPKNKESNRSFDSNPDSNIEKSEIKLLNSAFLQNSTVTSTNNNTEQAGEKYNRATNIECNKTNCVFPNFCSGENRICVCGISFAEFDLFQEKASNKSLLTENKNASNLNNTNTNNANIQTEITYCAYERKRQTVYFLLEFLLNIGAGHFYAKNYLFAALKFGLIFTPWSFIWIVILTGICGSDVFKDVKGVSTCFMLIFICLSGAWWITDAVLIGKSFFTDGNGVPLLSW